MHKKNHLLLLAILLGSTALLQAEEQEQRLMPEEIQVFYRDYNFVCSFTTPAERMRMAACLDDGVLPRELDSQRFQEVFSRMKRIIAQVHIVDSDMVYPRGSGKNLQKVVFRQELFEVKNYRLNGNSAGVDVFAYALEPEMVMRYISDYEENQGDGEKIPSESQILEEARSRIEQRQETHTWKYINGQWRKSFNSYIFLKK